MIQWDTLHTAGSLKFCFLVTVSLPCLNNSEIIFSLQGFASLACFKGNNSLRYHYYHKNQTLINFHCLSTVNFHSRVISLANA